MSLTRPVVPSVVVGVALLAGAAAGSGGVEGRGIECLGEAVVGREPVGVPGPVGGLSGLLRAGEDGRFFAIADDNFNPLAQRSQLVALALDPDLLEGPVAAQGSEVE